MKKLAMFSGCILLLFVLGCGGGSKSTYSANSPEATVQAYHQALSEGKLDIAFQYRKFDQPKTKEQWTSERKSTGMTFKEFTVGKAKITGTTAVVPVTFKTGNSSMPELTMNIQLVKEKTWLISSMGVGGTGAASGTGTMPPASGVNPHGAGGSIPLNK